ncbi:hypothetical protein AMJ57_03660 [Parcubacteria bacterium SG8_24]|nr:MAG: hypothetical protein AMJ57_03660 [Parcubacteria bacterium SG8_24]
MSRDNFPQACSFICRACGKLTASRSRWHVHHQLCSDDGCAEERARRPVPDPDDGLHQDPTVH